MSDPILDRVGGAGVPSPVGGPPSGPYDAVERISALEGRVEAVEESLSD